MAFETPARLADARELLLLALHDPGELADPGDQLGESRDRGRRRDVPLLHAGLRRARARGGRSLLRVGQLLQDVGEQRHRLLEPVEPVLGHACPRLRNIRFGRLALADVREQLRDCGDLRGHVVGEGGLRLRMLGRRRLLDAVRDRHQALERLREGAEERVLDRGGHRERLLSLRRLLPVLGLLVRGWRPGLLRLLVVVLLVVGRLGSLLRVVVLLVGAGLLPLLLVFHLGGGCWLLLRLLDIAVRVALVGHVAAPFHDEEPPLVRRPVHERDLLDDDVAEAVNAVRLVVLARCLCIRLVHRPLKRETPARPRDRAGA
jgi:hypothetical protein